MEKPLTTRVKERLPDSLVPLGRRVHHEARSAILLTELGRRRALRATSNAKERDLVSRVSPRSSPNENMCTNGWEHYFATGLGALRCIDTVLAEQGVQPKRILDLPSGWGRVMRYLAVRYPDADLVACDIVYDGPQFCESRFGAQAVRSATDFATLALPGPFDLIWVGSLFSHLDAEPAEALLGLAARTLTAGGVLVASTIGDTVVERREAAGDFPPQTAAAIESYKREGRGYFDHRPGLWADPDEEAAMKDSRYGVAYVSPEWMRAAAERAGLESIYFRSRGWGAHDVHGFRLAGEPPSP